MKKKLLAVFIAISILFGSSISVVADPGDGGWPPTRPPRPAQGVIIICDDIPPYDIPPCYDDAD